MALKRTFIQIKATNINFIRLLCPKSKKVYWNVLFLLFHQERYRLSVACIKVFYQNWRIVLVPDQCNKQLLFTVGFDRSNAVILVWFSIVCFSKILKVCIADYMATEVSTLWKLAIHSVNRMFSLYYVYL